MSLDVQTLKRKADFDLLKQTGKKVFPCYWLMVVYRENGLEESRFATTISKKIGSAVQRNRLKRWTREFFRKLEKESNWPIQVDLNLVFKSVGKDFYDKLEYQEFQQILYTGWGKIKKGFPRSK